MDELQAQVLRALLTTQGWSEYGETLQDTFMNANVRAIYASIRAMREQTDEDLTTGDLKLAIRAAYPDPERRDEMLEVARIIAEAERVTANALREAVTRVAKREYLAKAARYIATNLHAADIDADVAAALCQRAVDIAETTSGSVVALDETGLPGAVVDRPGLTSLGISAKLDSCLGGGVAAGELSVLLAPPARGKTSYLCAIGAKAAQGGSGVLHVTLEISARRVARRYDSALTGMSGSDMINAPKTVAAHRKAVREAGGAVYIKDWSYADVSPAEIKGLVKRMRQEGKTVDMVIVDYLELLKPNSQEGFARREQRHVYGMLGKQMRSTAVALEIPIITAWQVNREGSDMHNVELRHVSECWDIIKHADQIISLNQDDGERESRVMRIRILKQRDSTERPQIYLYSDLDRMQVRDRKEGGEPIEVQSLDAGTEVR